MSGIIVGVDGSGHSQRALEWAMKEAALRHVPLTVLTVHEAVKGYYGHTVAYSDDPDRTEQARAAAQAETDKVLAALTQKPFDTVWGKLVLGGKDTYGIDRQFLYPMVISEVRDGKVVDIAQVLPAALKK